MNLHFMKCGHRAQGINSAGKPVCVICIGILPGAEEPSSVVPDLAGREAFCRSCGAVRLSSIDLPFWERGRWRKGVMQMNQDSYYCGCRGWE